MAQTPEPNDHKAPTDDPVLVKRRRIARWAEVGQRVGYGLFGLAIVLFVVAMATSLPGGLITAILVCLGLGSVVLAPAIVVGYGVKAADREDRENASAIKRKPKDVSP